MTTAIQQKTKPGNGYIYVIVAALLIGLTIRWHVASEPIPGNKVWDHHMFIVWAAFMDSQGSTAALYDDIADGANRWYPEKQKVEYFESVDRQICNYPPGAGYVLAIQGALLRFFDPDMASNSPTARLCFSLGAFLMDILLALGCFMLVRSMSSSIIGAIAFALVFLMPPTILDSAWWGQTDSWVLAPGIWMLWAMTQKRWLLAGILWGIALSLKTQGILFAPIWLFAILVNKQRLRIVAGGVVAIAALFVIAIPYLQHSGMEWFRASYSSNLLHIYKLTTLSAYNIWYIDLLISDNHDAAVHLAGVEKDLWGKILFGVGFLICSGLLWVYRHRHPHVLLRFAGVTLLLAVMLPTRVHERYILLPLPFLLCAAMVYRRLLWGVLPLIAIATLQITSMTWTEIGAARWSQIENRVNIQLNQQYEQLRNTLPPEQFAQLLPPEEQIKKIHKDHNRARNNTNDPLQEWSLTIVALITTAICLITTIPGRKPSGDAVESNLANASG